MEYKNVRYLFARHFKSQRGPIDIIRPLNIAIAENQARRFRQSAEIRRLQVRATSPAQRAMESLSLGTLNATSPRMTVIPQLYLPNSRDGRLIAWAWGEYGNEIAGYVSDKDVLAALNRWGRTAAKAFFATRRDGTTTPFGDEVYFSHFPLVNFLALHVMRKAQPDGDWDEERSEECLINVAEGARFEARLEGSPFLVYIDLPVE